MVSSDRMVNWSGHLAAVRNSLEIFAAAGHFNYLKSAYLYLMKM